MSRMSILEAAEYFGVSKEAIHNRIRRGSLSSIVENGVKLVVVDKTAHSSVKSSARKVSGSMDDRYHKLLQEQNSALQARVEKLEQETKTLRDQKEQMLIQEREKIEEIYKQKDEQLKNILQAISSKFMLNAPGVEVIQEEHLDAEIELKENKQIEDDVISLKKYLKEHKVSKKKREKIHARFKKVAKEDNRIITIGKKHYLNRSKYDYSDLL